MKYYRAHMNMHTVITCTSTYKPTNHPTIRESCMFRSKVVYKAVEALQTRSLTGSRQFSYVFTEAGIIDD